MTEYITFGKTPWPRGVPGTEYIISARMFEWPPPPPTQSRHGLEEISNGIPCFLILISGGSDLHRIHLMCKSSTIIRDPLRSQAAIRGKEVSDK